MSNSNVSKNIIGREVVVDSSHLNILDAINVDDVVQVFDFAGNNQNFFIGTVYNTDNTHVYVTPLIRILNDTAVHEGFEFYSFPKPHWIIYDGEKIRTLGYTEHEEQIVVHKRRYFSPQPTIPEEAKKD